MAYFEKEIKDFSLVRPHLAPKTWGKSMEEVPSVVWEIGVFQDRGQLIELFNRFENFQKIWFEEAFNGHSLMEGTSSGAH
ncbi:MAG: hypothetical protein NUV68_07990 [Caldiserica bacterium]|nr:hypothetical protein [Caldisericota bacterium]MDH7563223.1 hypothetical protein [Caldisericota bacterium]